MCCSSGRLLLRFPRLELVEAVARVGDGELVDVEAADHNAVIIRPLARFGLKLEDEVAVGAHEVGAQIVVARQPDLEVEPVPAPEVALPGIVRKVAELDAPVEPGAERMRVDVIVEERRLVELKAHRLELARDLAP